MEIMWRSELGPAQLIYAAIRKGWALVFTCTTLLVANILFEIAGDVFARRDKRPGRHERRQGRYCA